MVCCHRFFECVSLCPTAELYTGKAKAYQAPFRVVHKGTRTRLEIINSDKYTARNAKTKKGKVN